MIIYLHYKNSNGQSFTLAHYL